MSEVETHIWGYAGKILRVDLTNGVIRPERNCRVQVLLKEIGLFEQSLPFGVTVRVNVGHKA